MLDIDGVIEYDRNGYTIITRLDIDGLMRILAELAREGFRQVRITRYHIILRRGSEYVYLAYRIGDGGIIIDGIRYQV